MSGFTRLTTYPNNGQTIGLDGGVDEFHHSTDVANNRCVSMSNYHIDGGKLLIRPRKKLWSVTFDNKFYGAAEYVDTTNTSYLFVASNGHLYNVSSSSKTVIDSDLTREELHFISHRGRCWFNGANTQRKISSLTASRVGVVAPETKPTVAQAGTGLTGSYAWKYTYVIKESGVKVWESDPSPVSDSKSLSNEGATITPAASGDSRVNARRIYRTSAGGAVYQYEGEIDNNTDGATFSSGSVTDANLGDIIETNHGVPDTGEFSEGCNERIFRLKNSYLYYSEQAHTEAYQEYQKTTNFKELPGNGKGTGIKRLSNTNTGREDLFVFQEKMISYLPDGDPNQPLITLNNKVGCKQHDTIKEYDKGLIFLSSEKSVCYLIGGRVIDISTRSIPVSLENALTQEYCRAEIIFSHYYAITTRNTHGRLWNDKTWICDLRTIKEVENGMADAVWYSWSIAADYLLTRQDGTVLAFDNNNCRIWELTFDESQDDTIAGGHETVTATRRWKDWGGDTPLMTKAPAQIVVTGKQQRNLAIDCYYGSDFEGGGASGLTMTRAEGGAVFIMGVSVMGSPTTQMPRKMTGSIPGDVVGNYVSFSFNKTTQDDFFELTGFVFTYNAFQGDTI